jgi:hypothetical protein
MTDLIERCSHRSVQYQSMARQLFDHEQYLHGKLDEFIETSNQQWTSRLDSHHLLHRTEPLLRKELDLYHVNMKSDVIIGVSRCCT